MISIEKGGFEPHRSLNKFCYESLSSLIFFFKKKMINIKTKESFHTAAYKLSRQHSCTEGFRSHNYFYLYKTIISE